MSSTLCDRVSEASRDAVLPAAFDYDEAFCRNRGLISSEEQEKLRRSHVAIIGMGGVGGLHLVTLARLGIGRFTIADPDVFEQANFNRQYGARIDTIGRNKAEVMAEELRRINPEASVHVMTEPIDPDNVDRFLDQADVLIDGVDFFNIAVRRLVFRKAAERGIWAVTAGPIGFSTAWLSFDPAGMTFDRYFGINDRMSRLEQLVAFAIGLTPRASQRHYMDLGKVDLTSQSGPCAGLACQLCAGAAAGETLKVLLGRGRLRPAPCYSQFDIYLSRLYRGRLHFWMRPILAIVRRRLVRRFALQDVQST
ncbi:ThiF family adenylyltransferase [Thermostilla marina]